MAERLREHHLDGVLHFAALVFVGESVHEPLRYDHNNTVGGLNLLRAMDLAGIDRLVFSSTYATDGVPETRPITEQTPRRPLGSRSCGARSRRGRVAWRPRPPRA